MTLISAEQIRSMSPEEAEDTLIATTSILPLLVAKAREQREKHPEMMTVKEAAAVSGLNQFFFYDHWKTLSFCSKLGRSIKINRKGLMQWLAMRSA